VSELRVVADLMAVAARTAPKSKGEDFVVVTVIEGDELQRLAAAMAAYGKRTGKRNFDRDGKNVSGSGALVLIGLKDAARCELNCGACGVETCELLDVNAHDGEFRGPQCAFRLLDMGIALGSAAKTAGLLNADSRIMYRAGAVARELGMIDADFVMGIPISATGKSIYFDR
jgi:uncharacterized ferredoxin-like protein